MKFLITLGAGEVRDSFFTPKVIAEIQKCGEIVYNETGELGLDKERLIEQIRDVDVLFTGWNTARVDKEVLAAANKLKIHAHTGGSVASYISKEEYDRGIIVLSGNELFAQSVAEGCLCYTLMALRRTYDYMKSIKDGGWRPDHDFAEGMIGKKIGIVGYGAIASYYAQLIQWFHPELLIYSKYLSEEELKIAHGREASMEEIFETCDIISLHAALNEENRGMITGDLLKRIKPGAVLVNTARAGLIEEEAFYQELMTGRFQAVIDVYHQEPLSPDHILRNLDNVLLMPHVAGPTFDMREKVVMRLLEDIKAIEDQQPYQSGIPYEYAIRMTIN